MERTVETMSMTKDLFANIRREIEASGLPIAEIARRSGISRRMIFYWLRGEHFPNITTLEKLEAALRKNGERH